MDDRTLILQRLNNGDNMDDLLNIYRDFNLNRKFLSPKVTNEFMVMGGMLYFFLYREAKFLDIIDDDIDHVILDKFWEYKTVDMDVQGQLVLTEDEDDKFLEYADLIKQKYFQIMINEIYPKNKEAFRFIHEILHNKPLFQYPIPEGLGAVSGPRCPECKRYPKIVGDNFGLAFEINDDLRFCRSQIAVKVGEEEDHIFEILMYSNFEDMITSVYNLKCIPQAFIGENIIVSMTQQIFPNQRGWRQIDKTKSAHQIFAQMKDIFNQNPLALTKFTQGYYRSYVVYYILKKAAKFNITHLLNIILPTNKVLVNKLFFFKSRLVSKITSPNILQKASSLYTILKAENPQSSASATHTLEFMIICLNLWNWYNECINK